jgi:hypothetical protein
LKRQFSPKSNIENIKNRTQKSELGVVTAPREKADKLAILFNHIFLTSPDWDLMIYASDAHQNALEIDEESLQSVKK